MINKTLMAGVASALLATGGAQAQLQAFKVNGEQVTVAEQQYLYDSAVKRGAKPDAQLEAAIRNAVIEQRVLAQIAKKNKLDRTDEVKMRLDNQRQAILANAALEDWVKKNPAKESEIRAAYNRAKEAYGNTEYKVSHIQFRTEDEAKEAIRELNGGLIKFADMARKRSTEAKTAEKGGELGWLSPQGLPATFASAFMVLKPGSVAQVPIRTDAGWQVIRLDETRKAQNFPTYESQKAAIGAQLTRMAAQKHFAELVKKAKIQ